MYIGQTICQPTHLPYTCMPIHIPNLPVLVINQLNAQNIVLQYVYYTTRFCALSWLITKIILRCTASKNQNIYLYTHLPTLISHLTTYLPIYLPTYLPTYLIPTHLTYLFPHSVPICSPSLLRPSLSSTCLYSESPVIAHARLQMRPCIVSHVTRMSGHEFKPAGFTERGYAHRSSQAL